MKNTLVIGKIKGIQIEVNSSWLIIFGLLTYMLATSYFPQFYPDWSAAIRWSLGAILALLLFISVLLHELSHSLVSISLGIEVKKISLFIFGGIAQIEGEPDEPIKELKIAVAGPAMSIFLSAMLLLAARMLGSAGAPEVVTVPVDYIGTANLVLAIFNLVPAFPLDGGRIMHAIIWHFNHNVQKATQIASSMGKMFGYFLIFMGTFSLLTGYIINGLWLIFIGWFINQAAQSSYQQMIMADLFDKIHVSEFMTDQVIIVDHNLSVQELVDGYFYRYKFAIFPVRRNDSIIGIINVDSLKQIPPEAWMETPVGSIATPLDKNLIVSPHDTVATAMNKLFSNRIGRVLVMDQAKILGIVSRTDILNYIRVHRQLNR